jgi:succinyldiaminopimelate transaminase
MTDKPDGFVPPPYPYDRLNELKPLGQHHEGGLIDFSVGTPMDPTPPAVVQALADSGSEKGYPPSIGRPELRFAFASWLAERTGAEVNPETEVAAAIGTKEFVAGLPHWMRLRRPDKDTVLYPAVSYPSYDMGAIFAGCRSVPVPVDENWSIRLDAISKEDADRALLLWVNTPGNPAGGLDDLPAIAEWGRSNGVPVFSDECYIEFTWDGDPRTILTNGTQGVVAVHSLSKRSNLAGLRVGFYAGDAEIVHYLREVRKHAGFMVPGPAQAAAVEALGDQVHVEEQRERYYSRLQRMAQVLESFDVEVQMPRGGFYLWVAAPDGDAWSFTRRLAREAGVLVSPGEFYGDQGKGHIRLAMVQPDSQIDVIERRLGL